jgi:hypothetical protein
MLWVYPLHRLSRQWLRNPLPHPNWSHPMQAITLSDLEMEQLHAQLRKLPEPRRGRRQLHPLAMVLTVAIAATLGGARGYQAIAEFAARLSQQQLRRLRGYYSHRRKRFEAPSEPTIRRVLQQIEPEALERAFRAWIQPHAPTDEAIAIDGKTLRGARREDGSQPHMLAALFHRQGTVLTQQQVAQKSNEIPALREMPEPLDISDRVVTLDAMHARRKTAAFLVEQKKAHYLFVVKKNQRRLTEDLDAVDWQAFPPGTAD